MTTDSYVLVKQAMDKVHSHSIYNKEEITQSTSCCCFYCKSRFPSNEVKWWTDKGTTALCPHCSVDSVIGDKSGIDLTDQLVNHMHEFWFERQVLPSDFDYSWFEPVKEER